MNVFYVIKIVLQHFYKVGIFWITYIHYIRCFHYVLFTNVYSETEDVVLPVFLTFCLIYVL